MLIHTVLTRQDHETAVQAAQLWHRIQPFPAVNTRRSSVLCYTRYSQGDSRPFEVLETDSIIVEVGSGLSGRDNSKDSFVKAELNNFQECKAIKLVHAGSKKID